MISNLLVGLLTGAASSFYVARIFHRNSHLDRALTLLKFCCPYRTNSVRPGDGLSDTAHALIIASEVMQHAWFTKQARVVRSIAAEMEALPSLAVPESDTDKAARDAIKKQWQDRLFRLYRPFYYRLTLGTRLLTYLSIRLTLVVSVVAGLVCVWLLPPPLYFRHDRLASGLPQPYLGFDPDRYLAGLPQRGAMALVAITAMKFIIGFFCVWVIYITAVFVWRGFQASKASTDA